MYSDDDPDKSGGFPIRISADQRMLASPRSFSQRATSFFASRCQGIHHMLLLTLQTLTGGQRAGARETPTPTRETNPGRAHKTLSFLRCKLTAITDPQSTHVQCRVLDALIQSIQPVRRTDHQTVITKNPYSRFQYKGRQAGEPATCNPSQSPASRQCLLSSILFVHKAGRERDAQPAIFVS